MAGAGPQPQGEHRLPVEPAAETWPHVKKKSLHASEQERPDVAKARVEWREAQPGLNPSRLVFIDETGASTKMTRLRGRCPRGKRLVASVPHGHWKTTTFIAALRIDRIDAPFVFDGAVDGACFLAWVRQHLVPALGAGDLAIMDNLATRKVAGVAEAIEAAGAALRYLPPYSPDLNPIEQAFAKLKAFLRKACARTKDDLDKAIANALDTYLPAEFANYFKDAGYFQAA